MGEMCALPYTYIAYYVQRVSVVRLCHCGLYPYWQRFYILENNELECASFQLIHKHCCFREMEVIH